MFRTKGRSRSPLPREVWVGRSPEAIPRFGLSAALGRTRLGRRPRVVGAAVPQPVLLPRRGGLRLPPPAAAVLTRAFALRGLFPKLCPQPREGRLRHRIGSGARSYASLGWTRSCRTWTQTGIGCGPARRGALVPGSINRTARLLPLGTRPDARTAPGAAARSATEFGLRTKTGDGRRAHASGRASRWGNRT